jgi:hypothetical protein
MSNGPFDQVLLNTREKVLSPDWNAEFSQQGRSLLDTLAQLSSRRTSAANSFGLVTDGFVGDSFSVHATSPASLNLVVTAGLAFVSNPYAIGNRSNIGGISGVNALSALVPIYLSAAQTFTVPTAPSAGNARIDIIEVRADHLVGGTDTRQVLDPTTGAFVATSVNKLMSWDVFGRIGYVAAGGSSTEPLSYKQGTAATAGTETQPTTTSGYIKIAAIRVAAGVTTIEENKILDYRPLYAPYGQMTIGITADVAAGATPYVNSVRVNAPPGVDVSLMLGPTGTVNEGLIYLRVGSGSAVWAVDGVSTSAGHTAGVTTTSVWSTQHTPPEAATLTALEQTMLAGGSASYTVATTMAAAIGQPVFKFYWWLGTLMHSGSALTAVTLDDASTATGAPTSAFPARFSAQISLVRIA